MEKQAILIMYHDDYYILEKLLKQIDNECFDIYLHVDKKVKKFDFEYTKNLLKNSNIYFVKRLNVKWSAFSQIECELHLLKEANKKNYTYYHLLSGNDLLLKNSDIIYDFFQNNKGYEFVAYSNIAKITEEQLSRIKYYHILNCNRRHKNKIIQAISNKIYYRLLTIQRKLKINRLRNNKLEVRKGANWFSITNDLAKYVLSKKDDIYNLYKYSNCADELFLQTITYNSNFRNKIYNKYNDEHKNIFRHIDWNRGEPYVFNINDYDELITSECFFARKFSSQHDTKIIDKIYQHTNKKGE